MSSENLTIEDIEQVTKGRKHYHNIEIDVDTHFWRENYGSDADGNRGQMRTYSENTAGNFADLFITVWDKKNPGHLKHLSRKIDIDKISDGLVVQQIERAVEDFEPKDNEPEEPDWNGDGDD